MGIVIIRNKRTGTEERTDEATADRLKASKYADNFEFKTISDPPEIAEVKPDHVHLDLTARKKKPKATDFDKYGI